MMCDNDYDHDNNYNEKDDHDDDVEDNDDVVNIMMIMLTTMVGMIISISSMNHQQQHPVLIQEPIEFKLETKSAARFARHSATLCTYSKNITSHHIIITSSLFIINIIINLTTLS